MGCLPFLQLKIVPSLLFVFATLAPKLVPVTYSIPFVVFHGLDDECSSSSVSNFTNSLINWSGSKGQCVEIGNGKWDSWFMPLTKQVDIACKKIKNLTELSNGYNMVGLSQGNIIGRAVIESCEGAPSVKNFISLAGVHAGVASVPYCGSSTVCSLVDDLIKFEIYSSFVQEHLAPSGYVKIPTDISKYLSGCRFLPKVNNEVDGNRNSTYKQRFSRLEKLVLIMFENDTVLIPKETSQFGFYPDGSFDTILPAEQTTLYTEDWIGLRALNEAGNVTFINVTGNHLQISAADIQKHVVPFLVDDASSKMAESSMSRSWFSSAREFLKMEIFRL